MQLVELITRALCMPKHFTCKDTSPVCKRGFATDSVSTVKG